MSLELITTICNVGTVGIFVAGAFAAIAQLRHVRAGNQLRAVLAVERRFGEDDLQAALLYVQDDLPRSLARADYRQELIDLGFIDARSHPEMTVCNWFNDMGTMIAGGFINEDVFFRSFAQLVTYYWSLLSPVIALLRRGRGDEQYAHCEFLAYRAQRWLDRNRSRSDDHVDNASNAAREGEAKCHSMP